MTQETCARQCLSRVWCRSFDFSPKDADGFCYLSEVVASDLEVKTGQESGLQLWLGAKYFERTSGELLDLTQKTRMQRHGVQDEQVRPRGGLDVAQRGPPRGWGRWWARTLCCPLRCSSPTGCPTRAVLCSFVLCPFALGLGSQSYVMMINERTGEHIREVSATAFVEGVQARGRARVRRSLPCRTRSPGAWLLC